MKTLVLSVIAAAVLAGCATAQISDSDRLALYQANAGAPVNTIMYTSPRGWDRVDSEHIVVDMAPNRQWLLTLSGNCLDWGTGSPFIGLEPKIGGMLAKFDEVHVKGAPMSCRINEIRPVNIKAIRASENALREQAKAQKS
ncbi:MAG: hypothetical protein KUL77_08275 [Thermomonas sp.]|uniref:DUF6491 family protein n=1 Tax=Thermomonas sp. TaxID=1971895 RepID=UPI001ED5C35D|nr:DUF6491 family protein [Thermomonas sp.]MBV2209544.1 hypothetical protein [Thermomonas sp.]